MSDGGRGAAFEPAKLSSSTGPSAAPAGPGPRAGVDPRAVLAAGVVHDLANMLTVVLSSLEQLRRQPLDRPAQHQLDRAQWGARRAARLSHQLRDTARHGDGLSAEAAVVDLNDAVASFASMMGQDAPGGARFAADLAPGPLTARCDAGQLELALLNLVHNAADATAGGGQVIVRTAGRTAGPGSDGLGGPRTVEVAVSDTGTGMAPATARQATEAFFTTKGEEHGSGLGLWMVRQFAEEAGGTVEIESALGRGTTVRLVLPHA